MASFSVDRERRDHHEQEHILIQETSIIYQSNTSDPVIVVKFSVDQSLLEPCSSIHIISFGAAPWSHLAF
jgi:hypothetical protein